VLINVVSLASIAGPLPAKSPDASASKANNNPVIGVDLHGLASVANAQDPSPRAGEMQRESYLVAIDTRLSSQYKRVALGKERSRPAQGRLKKARKVDAPQYCNTRCALARLVPTGKRRDTSMLIAADAAYRK
jgi:hypothetical protein